MSLYFLKLKKKMMPLIKNVFPKSQKISSHAILQFTSASLLSFSETGLSILFLMHINSVFGFVSFMLYKKLVGIFCRHLHYSAQ